MTARSQEHAATCEEVCAAVLAVAATRSMNASGACRGEPDLPGSMLASHTWPAMASSTFPPIGARCPHGVQFWAYPDANLVEALTQMNEGRYRHTSDGAR